MNTTTQINGLGVCGMTDQTIAIAAKLASYFNGEARRTQVLAAIESLGKPCKYSNENVDRRIHLAHLLADIMREEAP